MAAAAAVKNDNSLANESCNLVHLFSTLVNVLTCKFLWQKAAMN